jgi:hypothetical protein
MTEPNMDNFMLGDGGCNDVEDIGQSRETNSFEVLAYIENSEPLAPPREKK